MTTDLLLDVPPNRTRLDVWKERHEIWTHHNGDMPEPWLACAVGAFKASEHVESDESEFLDIEDLYSRFCRVLDECGFDAYAGTEEDACFELAKKRNIAWLESITPADCQI